MIGKKPLPNFVISRMVISRLTITIGKYKNLFLNFDFKINSSPIAERLTSEKTKRKIILEGCIDEIKGRFKIYGIFDIGFSRANNNATPINDIKKYMFLLLETKANVAKINGIIPIKPTNSA